MIEYNYIEIGNRIRYERKKRRLSQDELIENIRNKKKPTFSRNILSRLENGEESAFNGISMNKIIALCEELDCSLSYLLGEYSCKNYDSEFIHIQTGLTESAISSLLNANKTSKNKFLFVLSELIDQESLLELITKYFFISHNNSSTPLHSFYFDTQKGVIVPGKDCVIGNDDSEIYFIPEHCIELTPDIVKNSLLGTIQETLILFVKQHGINCTDSTWEITKN